MARIQIRGLPKGDYQVQCKSLDNWNKFIQTILPGCGSDGALDRYYKFTKTDSWDLDIHKFENVEEVTYDDWKQAIESHIRRVGDFKVGDLVYITKGYFDLKEGDVRALDGFDGMHWWIKTKEYPKIYLDADENFRHATKEEIPAQSNPPKPVSDLISDYSYSNIKGKKIAIHCPTQELWDKVIALIPNCRLNGKSAMSYGDRRCITPCVFNGSYSPIEYYKGEGYQIITAEEFIAANEKKHEYKVGDWVCILPNEMYGVITKGINPETPYKVKSVTEHCLYLEEAEKEALSKERFRHATPDEISKAKGSTTSKVRQEQKEESQTIIISKQTNTKTKQDENIKESSISISITEQCFITSGSYKFSKAAYIPGDEERITAGQRRKGSAVRG
jgi:hypothetical protein